MSEPSVPIRRVDSGEPRARPAANPFLRTLSIFKHSVPEGEARRALRGPDARPSRGGA